MNLIIHISAIDDNCMDCQFLDMQMSFCDLFDAMLETDENDNTVRCEECFGNEEN